MQGVGRACLRAVGVVGTALLLLIPAAAQGDRKVDDRFDVRRSWTQAPAIPGEPLTASPAGSTQRRKSKLTMNDEGGGEIVARGLAGDPPPCNLPEQLAAALYFGAALCGNTGGLTVPLFDVSVFPQRYFPTALAQRRYGMQGWGADELRSREAVAAAVEESAGEQRDFDFQSAYRLDPVPARWEATIDLLANPITSTDARRMLIDNYLSLSGATPTLGVTDPMGRPANLIETPDTSRAGVLRYTINGEVRTFDLRDAAALRLQLFYDPVTYDVLATRVLLDSTTVSELQSFAQSVAPDSPALSTTTFKPVKRVRKPGLTSYRIPCRKVDDPDPEDHFCVHVGPLNENVGIK